MAADSGGSIEPLQLEPFIHQVAGHSNMLQLDDHTICKPLIPQELNFYKTAPDNLKQFMAEYKGVIEVTFSEANDGYLDLIAYLPPSYKPSSKPNSRQNSVTENEHKAKHRIRLCQSGNIQIESLNCDDKKVAYDGSNPSKTQNGSLLNPWVTHCHQQQMIKLRNSSVVANQKYILLENRVSKYEVPCILDIKMGTRQYGDTATLAKIQSHTAKAAASTSSILGVRINGMMVHHHDSGQYICHNKYYGRGLNVEGFHQALLTFLCDGHRLRYKVISSLIEKLQRLYSVVQSLNTFRFFTSSLLIIYEGKNSYNKNGVTAEKNITLELSDNRNSSKQGASGLSHCSCRCCENCSGDVNNCENFTGCDSLEISDSSFPLVDICMIDFAHSTHSQMPDATVTHVGPDDGYLFGLENLIAHLEIILHTGK